MGKKSKRAFAEQAGQKRRPARRIETRGSLTFDSYLCCDHEWVPVQRILRNQDGNEDYVGGRLLAGMERLKPGQQLEFEMVCVRNGCGAGATYGEIAGRRKVVAYDRDWNYGIPREQPEDVREAAARGSDPVTWEDGLAS